MSFLLTGTNKWNKKYNNKEKHLSNYYKNKLTEEQGSRGDRNSYKFFLLINLIINIFKNITIVGESPKN